MKLVADRQIPCAEAWFGRLGGVRLIDGRAINPAVAADADVLIVRSVTRVDRALLEGSRVSCVASATSGTDHIDQAYLRHRGIHFSYAPGCNARSVAEYVIAALLTLQQQHRIGLSGGRAVVIGCGNIGSLVQRLLETLGMDCAALDPPLAASTGDDRYLALDAIRQADVISLHVPLVDGGDHPTRNMINAEFLRQLRPDAVLINTSRGGVLDEQALQRHLVDNRNFQVVLDVWRGEPNINRVLMQAADLATPHIAGYSLDGRIAAARAVSHAVCEFLGKGTAPAADPVTSGFEVCIPAGLDADAALADAVRGAYDILYDHQQMSALLECPEAEVAAAFDELRKLYRIRREFPAIHIKLAARAPVLEQKLAGLGFKVTAAR